MEPVVVLLVQFGDMMESVEEIILPESKIKISWLLIWQRNKSDK